MGACFSSKSDNYAPDAGQSSPRNEQQEHVNNAQRSEEIGPDVEQALRAAGSSTPSSRGDLGIITLGSVRNSNSMPLSVLLLTRSIRGTPASKTGVGADLGQIMDDQGMLNPMVSPSSWMHGMSHVRCPSRHITTSLTSQTSASGHASDVHHVALQRAVRVGVCPHPGED